MSGLQASSVAVIVPVYGVSLTTDEQIAIRHLRQHLWRYDCYQVSPQSLGFKIEGLKQRRYEDRWFEGVESYSRMLLSDWFYRSFQNYDYILIYQLDCVVFRDELQWWCDQGYDYIGAPLAVSKQEPARGFSRVGNGGLSLRRVQAFIDVLHAGKSSTQGILPMLRHGLPDLNHLPPWNRWRRTLQVAREVRRGVEAYALDYSCNEDLFWSDRARLFKPDFKIAPLEAGFQFAFEMWPRQCYGINGGKLPFGAHAWQKWDRDFWCPFLIPESSAHLARV